MRFLPFLAALVLVSLAGAVGYLVGGWLLATIFAGAVLASFVVTLAVVARRNVDPRPGYIERESHFY